jgi:hypothetical protein
MHREAAAGPCVVIATATPPDDTGREGGHRGEQSSAGADGVKFGEIPTGEC